MPGFLGDIFQRTILAEGSTRGVALMRIGVPLLLWTRWGDDFLPWQEVSQQNLSVMAIGLVFIASTFFMWVGLCSRFSSAIAAVSVLLIYYYIGRQLGQSHYAHHHSYVLVISTCLVALTPCGRSLSVDRWLAVRRARRRGAPAPQERGPLWGTRLIAFQVSMIYLWAAYDKTNMAFLSGDRMEAIFMDKYFGSDYPTLFGFHELMVASSIGTVILEYALAVGLWFRGPRMWLMIAGVLLHLGMYVTLRVHTFSLNMMLLYLAYIPPDTIHRALDDAIHPSSAGSAKDLP